MFGSVASRSAAIVLALCSGVSLGFAGGPYRVAGSGFDASVRGKAIIWRDGIVRYWTDQGRLNQAISGADADAAVAAAFRVWTDVPTAALTAIDAGQLGEDVSGADVAMVAGALELPADTEISSDEKLVVLYDEGGAITDVRFGAGASDPTECVTNAAWSYVDSYATDGHFAHAVLVLNGNCFESIDRLKYVLVRALGRLLGVGWSQLNDNAYTGKPLPTGIDFAGWPRMHPLDPWCLAYCNFDTRLRTDDIASISSLYALTADNVTQWPGKALFHETTATISGRVLFADGTPMQGVNVVARFWDPVAQRASRTIAVSAVSGASYVANRGNMVTGDYDTDGLRFDTFGGDDAELEGYYELPGLPPGQYQISVEPV
ncbi:MAG TPA: carboxypeptidase-like regulatory domain-containing protein, partial [Terriglobales bacterium]